MKTIIFDCDDVLLDWLGGFKDFLRVNHGFIPATPEPLSWDMRDWLEGREPRPLITQFNLSIRFGQLQPLPGAVEALTALHRRGWKIGVLSSCTVEGAPVTSMRSANLRSQFGNIFWSISTVPLGASKRPNLESLRPAVYVEDNIDHAISALSLGIETWMVRRPHNKSQEAGASLLKWVDNLPEMVSLLK